MHKMYHFILDLSEIEKKKYPFSVHFTLYVFWAHLWRLLFYMGLLQICYFHWSGSAACDTCMGQDNKRAENSQTPDGV